MAAITDQTPISSGAKSVFPNVAKVLTVPATQAVAVTVNGVAQADLAATASAGKTGYYQVQVQYYEE